MATCRKPEAASALHDLQERTPGDRLVIFQLDVTDPASIAACYAAVGQHTDALDVLINNAGAGTSQETLGEINQAVLLHTLPGQFYRTAARRAAVFAPYQGGYG